MAQQYYHHPFFGLLLYLASHALLLYYLLWMLVGYVDVPAEWQFVFSLFPAPVYRLVLPVLLFAFLTVYFTIIYILRRVKLAEQKAFLLGQNTREKQS
jgi:hypothetical protein